MIPHIYHISKNTFRECIRQPIYTILMLTSVGIIGNHPLMAMYVFREQEKLVTDGSLATVMTFGWITAVLCASHAIAREIDTGTVLLILAKPVKRATFVLAKILGILAALTLFVWVNGICVVLAVRTATDQFRFDPAIYGAILGGMALACLIGAIANYVRKSSFAAVTAIALLVIFTLLFVLIFFWPPYNMGWQWGEHVGYDTEIMKAGLLILFSVWAMGTLATALSTHFGLVSNLSICAVIFVIGLISDHLYGELGRMTLEQVTRLMHGWPFLLLPFFLFAWFLAGLHLGSRRNLRVRPWEMHLGFFALTTALLIKGATILASRSYLADPSLPLAVLARTAFSVKEAFREVLHAIVPNWQLFWLADHLSKGDPITLPYLVLGLLYIFIFIAMFGYLAYVMFLNREVGKQSLR